jgi:hypothetical protein
MVATEPDPYLSKPVGQLEVESPADWLTVCPVRPPNKPVGQLEVENGVSVGGSVSAFLGHVAERFLHRSVYACKGGDWADLLDV